LTMFDDVFFIDVLAGFPVVVYVAIASLWLKLNIIVYVFSRIFVHLAIFSFLFFFFRFI